MAWLTMLAAVLGSGLASQRSMAQEAPGPRWSMDGVEVVFGGRAQLQVNTTTAEGQPSREMLLRRVRLDARVRVNDLVSGQIHPEFAGERIHLADAYVLFTFAPEIELLAGRAKRPFGLMELTSSMRILPIERGLRIRGVDDFDAFALLNRLGYSDRDTGLQLRGRMGPLGLTYAAGVFAGPLQGRVGAEDSWQAVGRAAIAPTGNVRIGAGWSARDFARQIDATSFEVHRGNAFAVDLEYGSFAPGIHVLAELLAGDFDAITGDDFLGGHTWIAYRARPIGITSTIEPILRVSHARVERRAPGAPRLGGTLVTPGINFYFGGWNRIMLNYEAWTPADDRPLVHSFKSQFQLAF